MNKQKGFSLVEGLLVILILTIIGFGGYYVWNRDKDSTASNSETASQIAQSGVDDKLIEDECDVDDEPSDSCSVDSEDDISADWERYESSQGEFSIKIADGLEGVRDTTSDFFIFRTFSSNSGSAVVRDIDGYGSDGFTALSIYTADNDNLWQPTETENLVEVAFETDSGLEGTKRTYNDPYQPPCEAIGCYLGNKNVIYEFATGTKTTRIWYSRLVANEESRKVNGITEDSKDFTLEVEAMAKSLVIN